MEIVQPGGSSELDVGTTLILGGTNGLFLYDNNGVLGEIAGLTKSQADTYYYPLSTNPAGYLTDAPSDGSTYGRKNGAWAVAGGGSQTPWTSDIDGGTHNLYNIGGILDPRNTYTFIDATGVQNSNANISFAYGYTYFSNGAGTPLFITYPGGVAIGAYAAFSIESVGNGILTNQSNGVVSNIDGAIVYGQIPFPANNNQGYLTTPDLFYDTNASLFGVGTNGVPTAVGDFYAKTFTATGILPYGGYINGYTLGGNYNQGINGNIITYYFTTYKTIAGNNVYSTPVTLTITENWEATLSSLSEGYDGSSNYTASGQSFDYTVYSIYGSYYGIYPLDVPFTDTLNDGSPFGVNITITSGGGAGLTAPTFIYVNNTNGTYLVTSSTTVEDNGTWTYGTPSLGSALTFEITMSWANLSFEPLKITASGVGGQTQTQSILLASNGTAQMLTDNNDQWTGDGVVTPTSYTPLGLHTNSGATFDGNTEVNGYLAVTGNDGEGNGIITTQAFNGQGLFIGGRKIIDNSSQIYNPASNSVFLASDGSMQMPVVSKTSSSMPTSDPADGTHTLWYSTVTNQVFRGT